MVYVETATFECGGCGSRSPSTWIDYDRLGYPVCPECGLVERPFVVRPFGAGATVRRSGAGDAESTPAGAESGGAGARARRTVEPSR